ncbi:hypothetical protein CF651_14740 [Paenibacillus rigui]|uniref:Uncharacterized protein n=1 Tax=Paenibacillus rigui TaxID=554312 RepID=A0A229UQC9_9BACL|nr:hypothetical protein CF651_14740 [Paenibacillus rigui]
MLAFMESPLVSIYWMGMAPNQYIRNPLTKTGHILLIYHVENRSFVRDKKRHEWHFAHPYRPEIRIL